MSERNLGRFTALFGVALCVGLIIAHGLAPDDFLVDDTTIALVVVALVILLLPQLPTLVRYMARLRVSGVEAEFREVADRVAETLNALQFAPARPAGDVAPEEATTHFMSHSGLFVSERDPNIRIVRIAMELERGLENYARAKEIDVERLTLAQVARLLERREALTREQARILRDIAQLRNLAVHGARVTASDGLTFEGFVDRFLRSLG